MHLNNVLDWSRPVEMRCVLWIGRSVILQEIKSVFSENRTKHVNSGFAAWAVCSGRRAMRVVSY
jgi:hypothetical protein